MRVVSVTTRFPKSWRTTVTFSRPGVDGDPWSDNDVASTEYVVKNCLYSPGQSDGHVDFQEDAPETDGIIYTPVKQDIRPQDTGRWPDNKHSHQFDFTVNGWPKQLPYGMAVPIRWAL